MPVSRPTMMYVTTLGGSAIGLWAILAIGHRLTPPPNLAGQWQLISDVPIAAQSIGSQMHVEQSGKFFQVSFEKTGPLRLRLSNSDTSSRVVLDGKPWQLVFALENAEATQLTITAPEEKQSGTWAIHRLEKSPAGNEPAARGSH